MKNRTKYIGKYMTAAMVGSAACVPGGDASPRPNLLVILTHDMRIGMMSSAGRPYIKTPNLTFCPPAGFEGCAELTINGRPYPLETVCYQEEEVTV